MKKTPNLLDMRTKSLTVCGQALQRTWRAALGQGVLCGLLAASGCAQKPLDAQLRVDCAAQVPHLQPTAADAAAVDEIVAQLGDGEIDGEALLDACHEKGLFNARQTFALQKRLVGRAIAYRRLGLESVFVQKDKLTADASTPSERATRFSDSQTTAGSANHVSLGFDQSLKSAAADLMAGDILTNVQGRVSRAEGRGVWMQNAYGGGPLAVDVSAFALESVREPLPTFDASTITGDELCAQIGHRTERLSQRQCRDLQRMLAGRKLTLHDLRANGSGSILRDGKETAFGLYLKPTHGEHIAFRVSFASEEEVTLAKRLCADDNGLVAELVGTVAEDSPGRGAIDASQPVLSLRAEKIRLKRPLETLPPFDPNRVTAKELREMSAALTNGFTNVLVNDLVQRIGGREICLTNLVVTDYLTLPSGWALLQLLDDSAGDEWRQQLRLCAAVSADDVAALPWGFSRMCRIRRLTGRIAARPADVPNHYFGELFLNQSTFEAGWEREHLPTFDADTITGDELVELVSQSDGSHRPAQVRRMSQMIAPRRLTFSSGEILERRIAAGGRHLFRLGMGQRNRGGDFALIWESVARDGNRQVDDLAVGLQLKGISGILTTGDGQNGIPEIILDDMTFASATQAESLPAFDPKTLTGSDLVRMLSARKTLLTPSEVRLLQKGLAERELTIDLTIHEFLRYLSGAFGDGNGIRAFRLSFAQRDRRDAMCMVVCRLREGVAFSLDTLVRRQLADKRLRCRLTATVAPLRRADADGRFLVFEDASLDEIPAATK